MTSRQINRRRFELWDLVDVCCFVKINCLGLRGVAEVLEGDFGRILRNIWVDFVRDLEEYLIVI